MFVFVNQKESFSGEQEFFFLKCHLHLILSETILISLLVNAAKFSAQLLIIRSWLQLPDCILPSNKMKGKQFCLAKCNDAE